jgi:hypothetical protein
LDEGKSSLNFFTAKELSFQFPLTIGFNVGGFSCISESISLAVYATGSQTSVTYALFTVFHEGRTPPPPQTE